MVIRLAIVINHNGGEYSNCDGHGGMYSNCDLGGTYSNCDQ